VGAEAHFPVGGPECTALERATVLQMRERLVDAGLATDEEIDRHLAAVADGGLDFATSPMISAWGRKPESADWITDRTTAGAQAAQVTNR
jgi:hypothetical protein